MQKTAFLPFLFIFSLIACCIEVDISVPSFPAMSHYFGVSEGIVQLTIAINFLGFCLAALCHGPLSECYGRRKIMIIGNALLLLGAIGCVISPNMTALLISRFIQGIGASTSAVVVIAMIADVYQGQKAAKLISLMNAVVTILMAMAPVAGGFINDAIGWRGNYGLVAAICLISWLLLFFMLPETHFNQQPLKLKNILKDYKKLLISPKFLSASFAPSLMYSAYLAFIACASFLYMETFGLSIMAYTLHQACIVVAFSLVSIFFAKIESVLGSRSCVLTGISLTITGSLLLILLGQFSPDSAFLTSSIMIIFSIGTAMTYPVIFTQSMEIFPEIKGAASSTIMAMRALLCSAFVGLMGYFYNGHLGSVSLVIFTAVLLCSAFIFYLFHLEQLDNEHIHAKAS